jgi:hypothetical protein
MAKCDRKEFGFGWTAFIEMPSGRIEDYMYGLYLELDDALEQFSKGMGSVGRLIDTPAIKHPRLLQLRQEHEKRKAEEAALAQMEKERADADRVAYNQKRREYEELAKTCKFKKQKVNVVYSRNDKESVETIDALVYGQFAVSPRPDEEGGYSVIYIPSKKSAAFTSSRTNARIVAAAANQLDASAPDYLNMLKLKIRELHNFGFCL